MFGIEINKDDQNGFYSSQVDSPKFANQNKEKNHLPAFGQSFIDDCLSFDQKANEQSQQTEQMRKLKIIANISLNINILVQRLETMKCLWGLSEGFRSIFHHNSTLCLEHQTNKLLSCSVKIKLNTVFRIISKKHKLMKQSSFHSIFTHSLLLRNHLLNSKKLQTFDTRRYHQALLKQNQDRDNMNALEIQNTYLKKEILKQDREQNTFIENMTELLDRYDTIIDMPHVSTHRPYLTSMCSSPEPFQERKKMTSKGVERKSNKVRKH